MPIANCFVAGPVRSEARDGLIEAWARESGVAPDHMTVNLIGDVEQAGAPYAAMAILHLPSLWRPEQVDALQCGLAAALGEALGLDPAQVHVITTIVDSGHVVDGGNTREW